MPDHFNGHHFFNPGAPFDKGFGTLFKFFWERQKAPWPQWQELAHTDRPPRQLLAPSQLRIAFINHSSFLLQSQELNILTDPIWSERASPVTFAGPQRVHPPGINFSDLPKIDLVVISHNHYDHLDLPTLRKLHQQFRPQFVVGLRVAPLLRAEIDPQIDVVELDWGAQLEIGKSLQLTFLPAQHWSSRTPFDRNETLWGSFMLDFRQAGLRCYFGGDSGYAPHFKAIAQQFGRIDVALLPVGAYEPRWFMQYAHMNPAEAIGAFQDLQARVMIPMHFGTFQLSDEAYDQPLLDLQQQWNLAGLEAKQQRLQILRPAESLMVHP